MRKYDYNLVVLGGGSAGLIAALVGAQARAKVLLIEQDKLGGDCLYTGCVPSKSLIAAARAAHTIKNADEFGLKTGHFEVDYARIVQRISAVITAIEPKDSSERYSQMGVDCLEGRAHLVDSHTIAVNDRNYTARSIVIATGSTPKIPDINSLENVNYLTSDSIWELEDLPEQLVIVGGGAVGCELGQAYARLGSSVTIVEAASQLLPQEDLDIASVVEREFESEGIKIFLDSTIDRCNSETVSLKTNAETQELSYDQLLIATGRTPVVNGFGLEELGIECNAQGGVKVNQCMRTNIRSVYACGDVLGTDYFTHVAGQQGWIAGINALVRPFLQVRFNNNIIPSAVFTEPEIASVGLNERRAHARGIRYSLTVFPLAELDRALMDNRTAGFIKILTAEGRDRILGVSIVGQHAGELISNCVYAMTHGHGTNSILSTIHTYPTWTDSLRNTAGRRRQDSLPNFILRLAERINRWRRG